MWVKVCGDYVVLGGRLTCSQVRTVTKGLLVDEFARCFVDFIDEIEDFWYIPQAVMRLLASEFIRHYCDFRRRIAHISERVYMGVGKNMQTSPQAWPFDTPSINIRLSILRRLSSGQLFSLFLRIEISYVCLYPKTASTKPKKKIVGKEFCVKIQFIKCCPHQSKTKIERESVHY